MTFQLNKVNLRRRLCYLFIPIVCLPMINCWSQTISFKGGVNFSHIDAAYIPSYATPSDQWDMGQLPNYYSNNYVGWRISFAVDYFQKNRIFLSSCVGLTQNGSKGEELYQPDGDVFISKATNSQFKFIKLNTLFKVKHVIGEKFIASIGIGPEVNFMIQNELYSNSVSYTYHLKDNLNKVLFGLTANFGVKYNLNTIQLGWDIGYNYNLTRLQNYTRPVDTNMYPDHTVNFRMNLNNLFSNISIGYPL